MKSPEKNRSCFVNYRIRNNEIRVALYRHEKQFMSYICQISKSSNKPTRTLVSMTRSSVIDRFLVFYHITTKTNANPNSLTNLLPIKSYIYFLDILLLKRERQHHILLWRFDSEVVLIFGLFRELLLIFSDWICLCQYST